MTKEEVLQKLQGVFDNVFIDPVVVTDQLSADDVEEWDSLTHIGFLLAVEKAFGVRFGIGESESTSTVGELAALIARKVNEKA